MSLFPKLICSVHIDHSGCLQVRNESRPCFIPAVSKDFVWSPTVWLDAYVALRQVSFTYFQHCLEKSYCVQLSLISGLWISHVLVSYDCVNWLCKTLLIWHDTFFFNYVCNKLCKFSNIRIILNLSKSKFWPSFFYELLKIANKFTWTAESLLLCFII